MKHCIILFLLLAAAGWGATYYVRSAASGGNDGNDGSQATDAGGGVGPWLTIEYAIANAAAGTHTIDIQESATFIGDDPLDIAATADGKTLTVVGNGIDNTIIQASSATATIYCNADTTATITFQDMTFENDTVTNYGVRLGATCTDIDLRFVDCEFQVHGNTTSQYFVYTQNSSGTTAREIRFTRCILTGIGNVAGCSIFYIDTLSFDGCTIPTPGTNDFIASGAGDLETLIVKNNIITSGGDGIVLSSVTNVDEVLVYNNTMTIAGYGVIVPKYANECFVVGNSITSTFASAGKHGISIGSDTAPDPGDEFGLVVVSGNNVTVSGNVGHHGLFVGAGVSGPVVSGNYANAPFGFVMKCDYGLISGNIAIGGASNYAAIFKGGQYNNISNNTFVSGASGSGACNITDQAALDYADNNKFYNNVFDGSASGVGILLSSGSTWTNNIFDYNCYIGATNAIAFGATTKNTQALIQAYWAANGGNELAKLNDTNSIVISPQLDANHQAKNPQLKNAGSPLLIKSDGTVLLSNDIGVTKFTGGGSSGGLYKGIMN